MTWNVQEGDSDQVINPDLRGGGVHCWISWCPNSNTVALGELADRTQLFDTETGERLAVGTTTVVTGRWSHDGRHLAVPGVTISDADLNGLSKIQNFGEFVYRVSWSPDHRLIAGAGEGG